MLEGPSHPGPPTVPLLHPGQVRPAPPGRPPVESAISSHPGTPTRGDGGQELALAAAHAKQHNGQGHVSPAVSARLHQRSSPALSPRGVESDAGAEGDGRGGREGARRGRAKQRGEIRAQRGSSGSTNSDASRASNTSKNSNASKNSNTSKNSATSQTSRRGLGKQAVGTREVVPDNAGALSHVLEAAAHFALEVKKSVSWPFIELENRPAEIHFYA